jgi:hypothetical protein
MLIRYTPLRRAKAPPRVRARPRRGPDRDPAYLQWIRSLPCAICGANGARSEAAHTSVLGPRGLSQKASDYSAIPLCFGHHRGNADSYHALGERAFADKHAVDIPNLVRRLLSSYGRSPGGCACEQPGLSQPTSEKENGRVNARRLVRGAAWQNERMASIHGIRFPEDALERFCVENGIRKLSLFGSILRGDFRADSDVDIVVEFDTGRVPGLLGVARMERELSALLGRKVDLRTPEDLSRHFRDKVLSQVLVQYERV